MNDYLEQLKEFIIDNSNGTKLNVHLKIYSYGNGSYKIAKTIKDANNVQLEISIKPPFNIIGDIVNRLLLESKDWNILEFELELNGDYSWRTYWDDQREAIEKAPVFDENAEAEFVPDDIDADSDIVMDFTSTDSLRPWYFVKATKTSIAQIVETMLEQGAELDTDDLEDLDFNKESWKNIFNRLKEALNDHSEVKIKLDAEFDSETKAIEEIIFFISNDGLINEVRLTDY